MFRAMFGGNVSETNDKEGDSDSEVYLPFYKCTEMGIQKYKVYVEQIIIQ